MIFSFRGQLAAALITLLCFVLVLAALLVWGLRRTESYSQRLDLSQEELQAYLTLSADAYRHFKQMADALILKGTTADAHVLESQRNLYNALQALRTLTEREISGAIDEKDSEEEKEELARLAALQALIDQISTSFIDIRVLQGEDQGRESWQFLTHLLERTIDEEFRQLIDAAIQDERAEVAMIKQRRIRLARNLTATAVVVALASAVLAIVVAALLFRRLRDPIEALLNGTRRLANGELGHRIRAAGPREFVHLAEGFNKMAADLEKRTASLLETRSNLEKEVEERTAELHSANLELRRIDEVRRQFFADISHELRTPLTIIRGEAEVSLRGREKSADEYQTALRRIVELTGQLARLVDDLLFLARSQSSTTERIDLELLDLNQMLASVCEDIRALARQRDITVALNETDRPVLIVGDRRRLQQLFLILIDNALHYMEPGGRVALGLETDDGDAVATITDTGIGMDPEETELVFERFYRGKEARRRVPGGTGLGLPLAKAIVEAHHGRIAVASTPGVGTALTVRLPLAKRGTLADKDSAG